MAAAVEPFWKRKTLAEFSREEWESLCDGCGLCCLQKLEDEQDGGVYYTNVACQLLDLDSARCSNYPERQSIVADCIQLTAEQTEVFTWLPATCAYRLVHEGKDLFAWHHLQCGNRDAVHTEGISQLGRMVSELDVEPKDWERHLIFRSS